MRLLKQHDFAMIWCAGLLAYASRSIFFVALPIWVYQAYGSATLVGAATLMTMIPSVALGSVAGIYVDRWDRTRVMLTVSLVRASLLLVLALAARIESLSLILLVQLGSSTAGQFFAPAEQSLLPKLVTGEAELVQANSLNQLNNNLGSIAGAGLGGLLLAWIGLDGIALLMAALTGIGAALLSRIRYDDRRAPATPGSVERSFSLSRSARTLAADWRDGMRLFIRHPPIRTLLLIISVASVSNVGVNTLLAVFALETLHASEAEVGFLFTAGSIGGVIGAVLLGFVPSSLPAHRLLQASILAGTVLEIVFYGYPVFTGGILIVSIALEFIGGFPNAAANASIMTVFQTRVPDHLLGRAFGSLGSIQALVMLVATPIAGILADIFTAQSVLLVITLFSFASWILSLRLSDETPESELAGDAKPQTSGSLIRSTGTGQNRPGW
jgi:predicted MFS family arabinose efflux permease